MILDAALAYARRGIPVFPVRGKLPLTEHGFKDASTDADIIRGWWSQWPDANVAIAMGPASGLVALDVDPRHGGNKSLAGLEEKHGPLPVTLEACTGGGGRHIFFALPQGQIIRNSTGRLGSGLDVRGDGGYVVAPPSIHAETRKAYVWTNKVKPAPAPAWLTEASSPPSSKSETYTDSQIPAGQRNDVLTRIAGAMRRKGCMQEAIEAALLAENARRCSPPLAEGEVRAIARSVSRYAPESAGNVTQEAPSTQGGAVLRRMCDIEKRQLEWLWPSRIPLRKLTLFAGDPGLGKSLVTLDMAARTTRAGAWPDGTRPSCGPGAVVILSAEDDPADTIPPRLEAAGADLAKVHILHAVRRPKRNGGTSLEHFSLETDLTALQDAVASLDDARLIIIDPISAYLGSVDSHVNSRVRSLLAPLSQVAAATGVAVVAVTHLNKNNSSALYRASGSIAFTAAARAVWLFAKNPDDPAQRLMLPGKMNLAPEQGGISYKLEPKDHVAIVSWGHAVSVSADIALESEGPERRSDRMEAMEWLEERLSGGVVSQRAIKSDAARDGFSWATIRRAKDALGVVIEKNGFQGRSEWRLKGAHSKSAHLIHTDVSTFQHATENTNFNGNGAAKDAHPKEVSTFDAFADDGEVRL